MGKPAARKHDNVKSTRPGDVHIVMVPSPGGPVPTPLPHRVNNSPLKSKLAKQVKVNKRQAAVEGSISKHAPPHLPQSPGTMFQKMPKNRGKVFTASSNVYFDGKKAARKGDVVMMCADPADQPVGEIVTGSDNVLIGGGGSGGKGDTEGDGRGGKAAGARDAKIEEHETTGHPVDLSSGKVVACAEDLMLDGPLPLQFVRTWWSGNADRAGPLGYGWSHNYEESLERIAPGHGRWEQVHAEFLELDDPAPHERYLAYRLPLGTEVRLHDLEQGESFFEPTLGRRFARFDGAYTVMGSACAQRHFAPEPACPGRFRLVRIVDRHGNALQFHHDGAGRLDRVEDVYGRHLHLRYRPDGLIDTIAVSVCGRGERHWCRYEYDARRDLVAAADRGEGAARYGYDRHLLVEDRSAAGYAYYFQYDEQRRCIRTWGEDGYLTRYLSYDDREHRVWEINGEGETTLYLFDEDGVALGSQSTSGREVEQITDESGRSLATRAGSQISARALYDDAGTLAGLEDGTGATTELAHDELGRCVRVLQQEQTLVEREYGEGFEVLREMIAGRGEVRSEYDEHGRVVRRSGPMGDAAFEYDRFGHLERAAMKPGREVSFDFDPFGRLRSWQAGDQRREFEHDALDRPVRETLNGAVLGEWRFDAEGRLLLERDERGWVRRRRYAGPHLVEMQHWHDPGAGGEPALERYDYDREGRLRSVKDGGGALVELDYDEDGRLAAETFADGWRRERAYDDAGRLARLRDADGVERSFHYDGAGRLAEVSCGDGSRDVYDYDDAGRLVAASADQSEVGLERGEIGMVVACRQDGWEWRATLDDCGRRQRLEVDGFAEALEYRYGEGGMLVELRYGDLRERHEYDGDGELRSRVTMNGLVERIELDTLGHHRGRTVTGGDGELVYWSVARLEGIGRIAALTDSLRGERVFRYDERSRLTAVEADGAAERYRWDERNGLLAAQGLPSDPGPGGGRETGGAGEPGAVATARPHGLRSTRVLRGGGALELRYDGQGRLAGLAAEDGRVWEYRYDALGRRTRKITVQSGREIARCEYLWDGDWLLAERIVDEAGEARRLYVRDGELVLARIDERDGERRVIVYHCDQLDTPDVCTDGDGRIVWHRQSTAFGAGHDAGDIGQNIGCPGQYWDAESGLYYNRNRHFDPHAVRFVQADPLGVAAGWHPTAYPLDPLTCADPSGLSTRYRIPRRLSGSGTRLLHLSDDPEHMRFRTSNGVGSIPGNVHTAAGSVADMSRSLGQPVPHPFTGSSTQFAGTSQLVVTAHGRPGSLEWAGKGQLDGKQLARRLHVRGFEGDRVVMVVCSAGEQDAAGRCVAQDCADELARLRGPDGPPVEVIGADATVWSSGRTIWTGRTIRDMRGRPVANQEGFGDSSFKSFSAGRPPQRVRGGRGDMLWPHRDAADSTGQHRALPADAT